MTRFGDRQLALFIFSSSDLFLFHTRRIYLFDAIMAERPLNEHHEWGGQIFRSALTISTGGQTFLASQHAADTVPPQVPFTASYSDDLFAPATGGPSFPQPYVLPSLSDTLHHPHHNAQQTPTVIQQFPPPIPCLPHIPRFHHIPPSYDRPSFSHSSPTPYQHVHNPLPDVNQLPHHTAYHHPHYLLNLIFTMGYLILISRLFNMFTFSLHKTFHLFLLYPNPCLLYLQFILLTISLIFMPGTRVFALCCVFWESMATLLTLHCLSTPSGLINHRLCLLLYHSRQPMMKYMPTIGGRTMTMLLNMSLSVVWAV